MSSFQKPLPGIQLNKTHPFVKSLLTCFVLNDYKSNIVKNLVSGRPNGSVSGATWQPGIKGAELDFSNSTSDVIDCGVPFLGSTLTALTIEMIIRAESLINVMLAENGTGYTANTFYFFITSGGVLEFEVYGSTHSIRNGGTTLSAGNYYHIVGVWQPGNYPDVYLDGILDNAGTSGGTTTTLIDGNTNLEIGKRPGSTGISHNGGVVLFRAYEKAFDANEVMELYSNPYQMFDNWDYGFISTAGAALLKILNETENISENNQRNIIFNRILNEVEQLNEEELRNLIYNRILDENENINENVIKIGFLTRIKNETINIVESVLNFIGLIKIINETMSIIETLINKIVLFSAILIKGFIRIFKIDTEIRMFKIDTEIRVFRFDNDKRIFKTN